MTASDLIGGLVLIAMAALVIYRLDRVHQHSRHTRQSTRTLTGTTDIEDRDVIRVADEIRAAQVVGHPDRPAERTAQLTARTAATVRPASAIR
ncbi:hypothetical protein [Actinokineospora enzanensis]|uniref:hypothetical protein n=1 Tax=Actinokineospora enzanensis TaxID=155975 RepID=UPI000377EF7E|nr:hypothetical protein [Actinokineospora enzanensis]